jgi:UDP-N-acetylglucosamine:LPS N-acetylglucosamine transferase
MAEASLVICRSGYSSVMDLVKLQKKAVLIPTPGQTEQEYLAQWLQEKNVFHSCFQNDPKLGEVIKEAFSLPKRTLQVNFEGYKKALNDLGIQ